MTGRAPGWLRGIFIANLVAQSGIVITGGLVRLTGSGLGCPDWPQCTGDSLVPTAAQAESFHKFIEFGNRTLTFLLAVLAIAALAGALIWSRRLRAATGAGRGAVVALAAVPLAGTAAQAVLGGVTVLTGLNPGFVAGHFLLSMALIYACVVLVTRSGEPGDRPLTLTVSQPVRFLTGVLVGVAAVVLVLGTMVTGTGPHSGDADANGRLPFDARTVSWLHADLVLLFAGLTAGALVALYVVARQDNTTAVRTALRRAWELVAVIVFQGAVGYLQYFAGLPWYVVALHLLGSVLVWIAVVRLRLATRTRGRAARVAPDPGPAHERISV